MISSGKKYKAHMFGCVYVFRKGNKRWLHIKVFLNIFIKLYRCVESYVEKLHVLLEIGLSFFNTFEDRKLSANVSTYFVLLSIYQA